MWGKKEEKKENRCSNCGIPLKAELKFQIIDKETGEVIGELTDNGLENLQNHFFDNNKKGKK